MSLRAHLFAVLTLFLIDVCCGCVNPTVTSKSFTTEDATIVHEIGYIVQFKVKCESGTFSQLFAELDGNFLAIPEVAPHEYQVSWTEESSSARSGNIPLTIYDDEGFLLLKRAARSGEEPTEVPYLFSISVYHPGAFTGPWLKSEFLAVVLAASVAYVALSSRIKLAS